MQIIRLARPTTTVRRAPAAPAPQWEGIFVEPVYADGQPYDTGILEEDEAPIDGPSVAAARPPQRVLGKGLAMTL